MDPNHHMQPSITMNHQLALEDFHRCPGCYERLASHWLSDHTGDIPYVICHNAFCGDFNLGFPVGYGARLMEGDRRIPSNAEAYSTYPIDPLLMDHDMSASPENIAESEGQGLESICFVDPGMLPQAPPSYPPAVPSSPWTEPKVRQTRQKPVASTSKPRDPYAGEFSARLKKPLSELTKFYPEPILTIEAYVNRSIQERMEEAQAKRKVLRPVNAFMLYRKAYQAHGKEFCCTRGYTQVVISQVVADSWRLETEEVRSRFFKFAKIDKANHRLAHPAYKYTPGSGKPRCQ